METVKHYQKIGLLTLNSKSTEFLVIEKFPGDVGYTDYQMPGGQIEKETDIACLQREIKEELACSVEPSSIEYIAEYHGPAAGGGLLTMKLYLGELIGVPKASDEIKELHWVGIKDKDDLKLSEFIRTRIFPDILRKGLLKGN